MIQPNANTWEIAAAAAITAVFLVAGLWLLLRRGPTPEERERARRQFLSHSGRVVDGMLLDIYDIKAAAKSKNSPSRTLTMLLYSYRIGGVDYESSQDVTELLSVVDAVQVRAGFPCSARYQPGHPQNSIVVSEEWSGLRAGLPVLPEFENPEPVDTSHLEFLRPGRG
jgi:hypothetical protein